MSRSILKCADKRVVPIQASEGSDGRHHQPIGPVQQWAAVDDDPLLMKDVHQEMERIQTNLHKMHQKMMSNFSQGQGAFPSTPPFDNMLPAPPPPLQPLPLLSPTANSHGHLAITGGTSPTHHRLSPTMNGVKDEPSSPYGSLRRSHHGSASGSALVPLSPEPLAPLQPPMMLPPPPPLLPPMSLMPPPGAAAPSPVIRDDPMTGFRTMELVLDVKGYQPDDIHINTEGNVLYVHACRLAAKHDYNAGNVRDARVAKECRRQYTLPEVVRAENLRCFVNRKGELTIEGPLGPEVVRTLTKKRVKFASGNK